MGWTAEDIPDLAGRTVVVTGANGGLGLETARELARRRAHVVMAVRDEAKAAAAADAIRATIPAASLEIVALDLAAQDSVRSAAATILAAHRQVDILVNNAGVMAMPERRTVDGFELQLGVNHLGHWTLTARLMPALLRAPRARVVTVTSTAHLFGRPLDPANPHLHGTYGAWKAYCQSKLANFHFALGLHRRLHAAGAAAASLVTHPGLTNTDLQAHAAHENPADHWTPFWHAMAMRAGMSPAEGALCLLRPATDPRARSGQFYGPVWVNAGPPVRKPVLRRAGLGRAIDRLWLVSERETGERIDVGADQARPSRR